MNEINVSIPYSIFKELFYGWFGQYLGLSTEYTEKALSRAKEYWECFDNELQNNLITTCEKSKDLRGGRLIYEFIEWANQNRNNPQQTNTAKPLNNYLPVVNCKPYKGDLR